MINVTNGVSALPGCEKLQLPTITMNLGFLTSLRVQIYKKDANFAPWTLLKKQFYTLTIRLNIGLLTLAILDYYTINTDD